MKNSRGQNITDAGQLTTCPWILQPFTHTTTAVYCNKPVGWKMVRCDDGVRRRIYNTLCDDHQALAKQEVEDDE
jgi:hypothetical protein